MPTCYTEEHESLGTVVGSQNEPGILVYGLHNITALNNFYQKLFIVIGQLRKRRTTMYLHILHTVCVWSSVCLSQKSVTCSIELGVDILHKISFAPKI